MDKVIAVVIYLMPFMSFLLAIILAKLIIAYKATQKRYKNETLKNELSYQNKLEDTDIIKTNNIIDIETIAETSKSKSKTFESLYKRVGG